MKSSHRPRWRNSKSEINQDFEREMKRLEQEADSGSKSAAWLLNQYRTIDADFRRGERPFQKTSALGSRDPSSKDCEASNDCEDDGSRPSEKLMQNREIAKAIHQDFLEVLSILGFSNFHSEIIVDMLTRCTASDRAEEPTIYNYSFLAHQFTKVGFGKKAWSPEKIRYLLFVTIGGAWLDIWIDKIQSNRDLLERENRASERSIKALRETKRRLRRNRSWRAWDDALEQVYRRED